MVNSSSRWIFFFSHRSILEKFDPGKRGQHIILNHADNVSKRLKHSYFNFRNVYLDIYLDVGDKETPICSKAAAATTATAVWREYICSSASVRLWAPSLCLANAALTCPRSRWDLGPPLLRAPLQTGMHGDVSKVTPTHLPLCLHGGFRRRTSAQLFPEEKSRPQRARERGP